MSRGYDMMLRTWLGSTQLAFCAYFSGLALLLQLLVEFDCVVVLKQLNPHPP